jgi:polar amino acid transport system ATP-binding protein/putative ABC transport system ATP-binding protein
MIECRNINLSFGDKSIFNNLNIYIETGENVCLSGDSGKGKSSLLKLLQGYVVPDNGEIFINGIVLNPLNIKQIRNQIIWIPQNINLPANNGLGLLEIMNLNSKLQAVKNLLNRLGLEPDMISRSFKEISGGQKQRVITAICLSADKPLILLDEPTSALDETSVKLLSDLINSLTGSTVLSCSHDKKWLERVERIITI